MISPFVMIDRCRDRRFGYALDGEDLETIHPRTDAGRGMRVSVRVTLVAVEQTMPHRGGGASEAAHGGHQRCNQA